MFAQNKIKTRARRKPIIFVISLTLLSGNLFGQTNRLFFPFLDKESQSNVLVTALEEQPCPAQYTNVLPNTKLFTSEEQKIISEAFVKYKDVTTNSGPQGTMLASLYKTNYVIKATNRTFETENWIADFQYTIREAHERIQFGKGLLAEFRDKSNNGYDVFLIRTGVGTLLNFREIQHGVSSGLLARFTDNYPQGINWDFRRANFTTNSPLIEYRHYTNGMVLGKFFMWNPRNGNLILEAEFKEPYDFEKHRIQLQWK